MSSGLRLDERVERLPLGGRVLLRNPNGTRHLTLDPALADLVDDLGNGAGLEGEDLTGTYGDDAPALLAELRAGGFLAGVDPEPDPEVALTPEGLEWAAPGRAIQRLARLLGPVVVNPFGAALAALCALAAVALTVGAPTPDRHQLGPITTAVGVLAFGLVTLMVHETSHGLVVAHYGRRIGRVGIGFYWGNLSFFVDSTDAAFLPRRQRIAQAAAGVLGELAVTLPALIYARLHPDGAFAAIVIPAAGLALVEAALNYVPLLELDGYWILSDWLRQPELRRDSLHALRRRWNDEPAPKALAAYGAASLVFGVILLVTAAGWWWHTVHPILRGLRDAGPAGWPVLALFTLPILAILLHPLLALTRHTATDGTAPVFSADTRAAIRRARRLTCERGALLATLDACAATLDGGLAASNGDLTSAERHHWNAQRQVLAAARTLVDLPAVDARRLRRAADAVADGANLRRSAARRRRRARLVVVAGSAVAVATGVWGSGEMALTLAGLGVAGVMADLAEAAAVRHAARRADQAALAAVGTSDPDRLATLQAGLDQQSPAVARFVAAVGQRDHLDAVGDDPGCHRIAPTLTALRAAVDDTLARLIAVDDELRALAAGRGLHVADPATTVTALHQAGSAESVAFDHWTGRRRLIGGSGGNVGMALRALAGSRLRTALTLLSVMLGTAAVIMLVAVVSGTATLVQQRLNDLGATSVFVFRGDNEDDLGTKVRFNSLLPGDVDALRRRVSGVTTLAPTARTLVTATWRQRSYSPFDFAAAPPAFAAIYNVRLAEGEFYSDVDEANRAKVAVLGREVVSNLFDPGTEPVGQRISLNHVEFTVVGVMAEKGTVGGYNQDDIIFVPLATAVDHLTGPVDSYQTISMRAASPEEVAGVAAQVIQVLREEHGLGPDDPTGYQVLSSADIVAEIDSVSGQFNQLLLAVALISLLMGGVGVMNIMLVAVTERTHEIGIRKALGAARADIRAQFLTEAVTVTLIGGLLGTAVGVLLAGQPLGDVHPEVNIVAVAAALGVAVTVGVVAGLYPAERAARLTPVEALRFE